MQYTRITLRIRYDLYRALKHILKELRKKDFNLTEESNLMNYFNFNTLTEYLIIEGIKSDTSINSIMKELSDKNEKKRN